MRRRREGKDWRRVSRGLARRRRARRPSRVGGQGAWWGLPRPAPGPAPTASGPAPGLRPRPPRDLVLAARAAPQPPFPPSPGEVPRSGDAGGWGWRSSRRLGCVRGCPVRLPALSLRRPFPSAVAFPPVPLRVLSPPHLAGDPGSPWVLASLLPRAQSLVQPFLLV